MSHYSGMTKDFGLTAEQLDDKYNADGDGEHPKFGRWDWRQMVASQSTISGYWGWVCHMLSIAQEDLDEPNPHA